MFGQGHQSCKEGSGFGLLTLWDSRDGSQPPQLPQGLCTDAKSKYPDLAACIVCGRVASKVKAHPTNILVRSNGLADSARFRALVGVLLVFVSSGIQPLDHRGSSSGQMMRSIHNSGGRGL